MVRLRKRNNKKLKLLIIVGSLLLLAACLFFILEKKGVIDVFSPKKESGDQSIETTSDLPSAQSDYSGDPATDEHKAPGNTLNENQGSAVITDNNGAASTDTSAPRTSPTGEITVYTPRDNVVVATGQEISGKSTLASVQYRLIDDVSGVIATGSLNVVNGNFSGTLSFTTSAREGRLDIFGIRSDASEFSNVEIPVRFK